MNKIASPLHGSPASDAGAVKAFERQRPTLRNWLRRNMANRADIEEILQDAFLELVLAYRAARQIEDVGAWLFRVARNRLIDGARKRQVRQEVDMPGADSAEGMASLAELLPDPRAGPEARYARSVLVDEVVAALGELPSEQREVFLAHEIEGLAFAEIAARTGVGINTALARKRQAVLQLRRRLAAVYRDFLSE
jgi:RNA polymerase sigma factor (sigma-70 family)